MAQIFGVDVSHWDGVVDWDVALAVDIPAKISFVFVKSSQLYSSSGIAIRQHDSQFDRNWGELTRLNVLRGAYHYCMPGYSAQDMFDLFFSIYNPAAGDLLPALDIEDEYLSAMTSGAHTRAELVTQILDFGNLIQAKIGKKPFIYTRSDIADALGNPPEFAAFPLWLAQWGTANPTIANPWNNYTIWQYLNTGAWNGFPPSDTGSRNTVDFDRFDGTSADLQLLSI